MHTAESTRFIKLTVKICSYVGTSPYFWSDQKHVEFAGRKALRFFGFLAQLALGIAYESFVLGRWIQTSYFDHDASTKGKSGLEYIAFAYSILVLLHLCSFFNADQFHLLINRMIRYQQGPLLSSKIIGKVF